MGTATVRVNASPTIAQGPTATPSPVTGTSTALSVLGADADDAETTLTYAWSTVGTPPAPPTLSATTGKAVTATFTKTGTYTFQATVKDPLLASTSGTVSVVVVPTSPSLTVTPTSTRVIRGGTATFTAPAVDQFGVSIPTTWSVSGGGTIANGVFTAGTTPGAYTVTATAGGRTSTASVQVDAPPTLAQGPTATPSSVTGTTSILSVLGADADDAETTLTYAWSTVGTPPAPPTLSATAGKAITATFTKTGTYTFQVMMKDPLLSSVSGTVSVTVVPTAPSLVAAPATAVVVPSGTTTFSAPAVDQFATAIPTTWSVSGGGTISSSGVFTAGTVAGTYTVTATAGGKTSTASVRVNAAPTIATGATATPSPATSTTVALAVLGADDGGEAALTYTWSPVGTPPAQVTFSATGTNAAKNVTATFTKAGAYTLLVTAKDLQNATATSQVTVTVAQTATTVSVTPASTAIVPSGTTTFSAVAVDQFGTAFLTAPTFTWTVSGGGSVSSAGVFTAGTTPGMYTVTATTGGKAGTAAVRVNAAPTIATAASVTPSPVTGTTATLAVLGADDAGEAALTYAWAPTGTPPAQVTFSATGTNPAKNVTATFIKAGTYTLQVTATDAQTATVTSSVTAVVIQTITTVAVAPTTAAVAPSGTTTFTASGKDQFGAALVTAPTFTWTVSGGGTISSAGVFTAGTVAGTYTVTATSGGKSGTATVRVNAAPTVATAAKATPSPTLTTTTALTVLGADDAGEAGLTYAWSTSGTPPAQVTFSATGTNGAKNVTATFTKLGSYTLLATITDGQAATVTSPVTVVVTQGVGAIAVTPTSTAVSPSGSTTFNAVATDQFGGAFSTAPTFTWSVSGGGTISSTGVFTAGTTPGTYTVTAASGGKTGMASVRVNAAPTIATGAKATPSPATGTTTALSVLGADDAGEGLLTYTWSTTSMPAGAAATFSPNGTNLAKASTVTVTKAGTYSFLATVKDGQNATVTSPVTVVVQQTPTVVTVTPATAVVVPSGTFTFAASATDQFGAVVAPAPTFAWSALGGTIGAATGLFTAGVTPGTYTIIATTAGKSGTASIRVNAAPTIATVASATPSPVTGTTTAMSVLGADDAGEAGLTYAWAPSGTPPAGVTFAATGTNGAKNTTATFTKAGSYTLQATVTDGQNAIATSSVAVTVAQTLTTITLSPTATAVVPSGTVSFTATAKDQFAAVFTTAPTFTWTVSGGGTISAAGVFTAGTTPGTYTVTAASGGKTATTTVRVNAAPTIATAASATPSPVTGTTTALSVLGADDAGEGGVTYVWAPTGTPPAQVTFSATGTNPAKNVTATFTKAGTYTLQVTATDAQNATVTSSVTAVVNQTITTVAVAPTTAAVVPSGTTTFTASGKDQFGAALITAPTFTWTVSGGGTISSAGVFTAGTVPGTYTVTATNGGKSGSATVRVNAAPTIATAATATPSPTLTTTTALTVLGADDAGEAGLTYAWSTSGTPPAQVTFSATGINAAKNVTATFTKLGSYTLLATITDGQTATVTSPVTVLVNQGVGVIAVTPTSTAISPSGTTTFSAVATDQFGGAFSTAPTFTWSVSGGGTISAGGVFTAGTTPGTYTVTAASGGKTVTATVRVNAAPTIATVAKATPSPALGTTTALSVLAADDAGEGLLTYTWTTTSMPAGASATFSPNGTNVAKASTVTVTKAGSYSFLVTVKDGQTATATSPVTVIVQQTPTVVSVAPTTAVAIPGGTFTFSASATDQFGAVVSPAPAFTWSALGGTIGATTGVFTAGVTPGTYTITATTAGKSGTASIRINAAPTIATPASATPSPVIGTTTAVSVLGADDAGEAGLTYVWAPTGASPTGVTFAATGTNGAKNTTATFTKAGSYTLQATVTDGQSATATSSVAVTVAQTVTTITLSPTVTAVVPNGTVPFTATAKDQFAAVFTTAPTFTWTVSGGGTISAAGVFTAGTTPGTYTVTAASGGKTATTTIRVNAAPTIATAASVTPSPVTGTTATLAVLGADDAGEAALTYAWAPTGTLPAQVTFSATGTNPAKNVTATFTKAGSYTFQATVTDGQSATTTSNVAVTVAQTITTITVSSIATVVAPGGTMSFVATAKDQFTTVLTTAPTFTWAINGGGTISAAGVLTAGTTPGTYTVTATAGGKTGSTTIRVNAPPTVTTVATAVESIPNANWALTVQGADSDGGGTAALKYTWTAVPSAGVAFSAANGSTTGNSITATFATAGSYTLTATITDSDTATVTSSVAITAVNRDQPPVIAGITVPATVTGTTASVTVTATDDKPGLTYAWSATNGATVTNATSASATVTFVQPGSSTVTVMVSDVGGHVVPASATTQVVATATDLRVTSAASSVWIGGKTVLTAGLLDQFNQPLTTPLTATWSVSGPATIAGLSALTATLTGATPGGTATATATLSSISRALEVLVRAESAPSVIDPSAPPSSPVALVPGGSIWVGTPLSSQAPGAFIATVDPGDGSGAFPLFPGVPAQIHYGQPGAYTVTYQDGTTPKTFTVYVIQVRFPVEDIVVLDTNARDVPVDVIPAAARSLVAFSATDSSVTVSSVSTGMHLGGSKGVRCTILAKTNVTPIQLIGQTDATICHIDADLKSLGVIQGVTTTLQWGWTQPTQPSASNDIYGTPTYVIGTYQMYPYGSDCVKPWAPGSRKILSYPPALAFGLFRVTPKVSNLTYQVTAGGSSPAIELGVALPSDGTASLLRLVPLKSAGRTQVKITDFPTYSAFTTRVTTVQNGSPIDLSSPAVFTPTVKKLAVDVVPTGDWTVAAQSWGEKQVAVKIQGDAQVVTALNDWQDKAQVTTNGIFHSKTFSLNTDDLFPQIGPSRFVSAHDCFAAGLADGLTGVTPFKVYTESFVGHHFFMDPDPKALHSYQFQLPGLGLASSFDFNWDATGITWENTYSVTAAREDDTALLTSSLYQIFDMGIFSDYGFTDDFDFAYYGQFFANDDYQGAKDYMESQLNGIMAGVEVSPWITNRPTGSPESQNGYAFEDLTFNFGNKVQSVFSGGFTPDYWLDPADAPKDAPHIAFNPAAVRLHVTSATAAMESGSHAGTASPLGGPGLQYSYSHPVITKIFSSKNNTVAEPLFFSGIASSRISKTNVWSLVIDKPGVFHASSQRVYFKGPTEKSNMKGKSKGGFRIMSLIGGSASRFGAYDGFGGDYDIQYLGSDLDYPDTQFDADGNDTDSHWATYSEIYTSQQGVTPLTIHVDGVSLSAGTGGLASTIGDTGVTIRTDAWGDAYLGRSATVTVPPANVFLTKTPGNLSTVLAADSLVTLTNDDDPKVPAHGWALGVEPASLSGILTVKIQVAGTPDATAEIRRPLKVGAQGSSWKTVVPNAVAVDAMSGDVRFSRPVVRYTTSDPGPDVTLTYNSLDGTKTGVGTGWRTNYDARVITVPKTSTEDENVWWIDEQGSWWNFKTIEAGPTAHLTVRRSSQIPSVRLITRTGELGPVAGTAADGFLTGETACVTPGDGRALWFDAKGFLVRVTFQRGGTLTVTRDPTTGDAITVNDDKGRSETLNAYGLGEATSQSLNVQETGAWTFTFANSGGIRRLTKIGWGGASQQVEFTYQVDVASDTSDDWKANRVLTYTIKGSGTGDSTLQSEVIYTRGTPNNVTTIGLTGQSASLLTWTFDQQGVLQKTKEQSLGSGIETVYTYGSPATAAPTQITIGGAVVEQSTYDTLGRLTQRITSPGATAPPRTESFAYTYSTAATVPLLPSSVTPLIERSTVQGVTGTSGGTVDLTTRYAYTTAGTCSGLVAKRTDPDGAVTSWTYAGDGRVASWTDPRSKTTTVSALNTYGDPSTLTLPGTRARTQQQTIDKYGYTTSSQGFIGGATTGVPNADHHHEGKTTTPDGSSVAITTVANDLMQKVVTEAKTATGTVITTTVMTTYDMLGRPVLEQTTNRTDITTTYTLQDAAKPGWRVTRKQGMEVLSDAWIDFAGRTRETYQWVTKVGGTAAAQAQTTVYTYSPTDGRLTSIAPPADTKTDVVSDFQGRILKTTQGAAITSRTINALGWELTSTDVNNLITPTVYDAMGRVKYAKNPAGGWTWLTYDAAGNLTTTESSTGVKTSQEFDDAGILTATIDGFGRRTTQTIGGTMAPTITWKDPNLSAVTTTATLDGALRPTQQKVTGADSLAATTTITPGVLGDSVVVPAGRKQVVATVDSLGRLSTSKVTTTLATPDVLFGSTNGYGTNDHVTSVTRDDGLKQTFTIDATTGETNVVSSTATTDTATAVMTITKRDARGRTLEWTDGDGFTSQQTFDTLGRLLTVTPPNGVTSTYAYTGGSDRADSITNAVDGIRSFTYHTLGGTTSVLRGTVQEQGATYDRDGRILTSTAKGITTTTTYDPTTGAVASVTDPRGTTTYVPNARGLITRIDYPNSRSVQIAYDDNERPKKRTYSDGTYEQLTYDANGDVATVRDRAGRTQTVTTRDGTGAPRLVTADTGEKRATDIAVRTGGGFATTTTETVGGTSRAAVVTTNGAGSTVSTTLPGQAAIASSLTAGGQVATRGGLTYTRPDANTVVVKEGTTTQATITLQNGRVATVAFANGHTRQNTFTNGKLTTSKESVGSLSWTTSYTWGSDDRLASRTTPFETESYTYDPAGRLSGWQRTGSYDASATYGFDGAGRRTTDSVIGSPKAQQAVAFTTSTSPLQPILGTWAATGSAATGTGSVTSDALATMSAGTDPQTFVSATVVLPQPTSLGYREATLVVNGVLTNNVLVSWDEWRAVMTKTGTGITLTGVLVHVDGNGEKELGRTAAVTAPTAPNAVLSLTQQSGGVVAAITPSGTGTLTTVSPLTVQSVTLAGRIGAAASTDSGTPVVTLNELRWTPAGVYRKRSYIYNNADQLTSISEQTQAGTRTGTPAYDAVGNRTGLTWSDNVGSLVNTYDRWNRLASEKVGAGSASAITYIPGGVERLSRGSTTFTRDASGLLGITQGSTTTTYGAFGSLPLYENTGGTITTLAVDADRTIRGRVGKIGTSSPMFLSRLFTNPTGEVAGQLTAQSTTQTAAAMMLMGAAAPTDVTIPSGYTWADSAVTDGRGWHGLWFDASSKSYQMGHRTYSADTNSFDQRDPAQVGDDWYRYASGDPVNRWDPSGLDDIEIDADGTVQWLSQADGVTIARTPIGYGAGSGDAVQMYGLPGTTASLRILRQVAQDAGDSGSYPSLLIGIVGRGTQRAIQLSAAVSGGGSGAAGYTVFRGSSLWGTSGDSFVARNGSAAAVAGYVGSLADAVASLPVEPGLQMADVGALATTSNGVPVSMRSQMGLAAQGMINSGLGAGPTAFALATPQVALAIPIARPIGGIVSNATSRILGGMSTESRIASQLGMYLDDMIQAPRIGTGQPAGILGMARNGDDLILQEPVLYRGIPRGPARFDDAIKGIVRPRGNLVSYDALEKHVLGETVASGVTSWTTDINVARRFAGRDGVILSVDLERVRDLVMPRPNVGGKYVNELETLLRGDIFGAKVLWP